MDDINPIKSDAELQMLVKKLDRVKKYNSFQRWKGQFLSRLEDFLYDKGMEPAEKSCNALEDSLKKLVGKTTKVLDFIHKGDLGEDKKTVKASLALNEMCNSLENVRVEIENLIPSLKQDEKKKGFSKFHLGAALIRQGFHQYITMKAVEDAVTEIGEKLENVVDRQQRDLFIYYHTQVKRFCDVMADLNLYAIMMKCVEFSTPPDGDESEDPEYVNIVVEASDGRKLPMEVDTNDTVAGIRDAIEAGLNIPVPRQILKFRGTIIEDDGKTMDGLGVEDGAVFFVEPLKIPITVNAPGGKTIELMVDPANYLSDLKRMLEPESGIPGMNQHLSMGGVELDDPNKSLDDYGIVAGSVLDLEPKTIKVNVEMPDGKSFQIELSPHDETPTIKNKIEEISGMAVPRQVVKHQGEELPADGVSCKDMGITEGSTLNVDIFKIPITVNAPEGKTIELMVDPTNYLSDLKRQLEPESGIPGKNQVLTMAGEELDDASKKLQDYGIEAGSVLDLEPKIITVKVEMHDGKSFQIELSPKDDTPTIKNKIAEKSGLAVPRQVVKHDGEELPSEGATCKDMGIKDGSTLNVDIFKIPITVNAPEGKTIELMVDPTNYLSDLKRILEPESGIPAKNQNLSMAGEELPDPSKKLEDYGIEAGSVLDLEPKTVKINVEMPDGKSFELEISPNDDTNAIKEKIAAKTGMAVPRQLLKHLGEVLPEEGVSSKDMGIKEGSTVAVEIFTLPVTVNCWDGKVIQIEVEPTDDLSKIKGMLEPESGIPPSNQVLSNTGEELQGDKKTAVDLGIQAGTVLDLEPREVVVKVQAPDGTVHDIKIALADTADEIKTKIAAKTGIAVPRQVVKHDGEELPTGTSAKDMGLKDGSDLTVDIFKLPVTVNTWDGKQIQIEVEPTDDLTAIKKMLEPESGIPPNNQVLSKAGEELTGDGSTASDLGIEAGAVLDLEPRNIILKVQTPDGATHDVEIALVDDADAIKQKIEAKTGIAVPRQVVKHDGEELPTGTSAKDMGLKDGSDLTVDIFKLPVTVNTWDGKQIQIEVEPTDDLTAIKKMLEPESGIPPNNQVLSKAGEELTGDGSTASDLGIEAGAVLDLEPRNIILKVQTPDGATHDVEIALVDDADAIKQKIEAKTGIAVPRQVVKHDGEELPTGTSAKDMGLKDGSDLTVDIFKLPVTVNTWDGKQIQIEVEPTDDLTAIKKMLEPESGIPPNNQVLSKAGEELTGDGSTASDLGIEAGAVLDLEPRNIILKVQTPDGATHDVEIALVDDADAIKQKIEAKTGIAVPRQVVKHDGEELPTGTSAKDMGLKDGSDLTVDIFKLPVTVNTWDGKQIQIEVEPTDDLTAIKKMLEPESGIPTDNQVLSLQGNELIGDDTAAPDLGIVAGSVLDLDPRNITVKVHTPDGNSHDMEVALVDDADAIKQKIEAKTGIKVPRQLVKHNGEEMPTGTSAKEMGLRDGSDLNVEIFKIPITVNSWDGRSVEIEVEPSQDLASVKKMLEPEFDIPVDRQVLSKDGNELSDNSKSVDEEGIKAGSVLDLEPRTIKVNVTMPDGETKAVEISPRDDGDAIKDKIEAQTGLKAPRQVLSFDGNEIPSKGATAKDLGIRDGSNIKADILKIPVTVNCYDGTKIELMVEPSEKLSSIKKQLEPESGIKSANQHLSRLGKELAGDDKTANEHGIKAGTVLDLEPKLLNVTVTMPDGKKHQIEVAPSDDGNAIKMKIEKETGMEAPRQVLKFNGKDIPNNGTARDAGIRDGSNIDVELFRVQVTVNTWDGNVIKIMVDPTDKLIEIKNTLEPESGIVPQNQILYMNDVELYDNNKRANAYGIVAGSTLYLEPKYIGVTVIMPDGSSCTTEVSANTTGDELKGKVATETGVAATRQVLHFNGKEMLADFTIRGMGIKDKSTLQCTLFKIPITVETKDGKTIPLKIEPIETIDGIKAMLEEPSGLAPRRQVLKFVEEELTVGKRTATECGIKKDSVLELEPKDDPIVFVDCKYGTLFGVDRDEVIQRGMLTTNQGNTFEFNEAEKGSFGKDKLKQAMLDSPNLGVKPQIVIEKQEVEDYDLAEAENVKSKWGVQLKKTAKNTKGEELIFVDIKTGSFGLLDRKKFMDQKFITPVGSGKDATLKEAETQTRVYDRYVHSIRTIFGIKSAA